MVSASTTAQSATDVQSPVEEAPEAPAPPVQVPGAEALLARLFAIRMMISDVTEEIHTLREGYGLDDDEIVEDIDDDGDDLSDIEQDALPDDGAPTKRSSKVGEAA